MTKLTNSQKGIETKKTIEEGNYFFRHKYILMYNSDIISYILATKSIYSYLNIGIEILKIEVKKRLNESDILFTDTHFGIYINMTTIQYRIVFSENSIAYKIYTGQGIELGCSTHNFMMKNDPFEALDWIILEIDLDSSLFWARNVFKNNLKVA